MGSSRQEVMAKIDSSIWPDPPGYRETVERIEARRQSLAAAAELEKAAKAEATKQKLAAAKPKRQKGCYAKSRR